MSANGGEKTQNATDGKEDSGDTIAAEIEKDAEDSSEGSETKTEKDGGTGEFFPDDDLMERAVKSGLTISDAKAFKSKEALERVCAALEKKGVAGKPEEKTKDEDGFAGLDLGEDGDWDEGVVKYSKSVKGAFQKLKGEIDGLKAALAAKGVPDGEVSRADRADAAEKLKKRSEMALQRPGNGAAGEKKTSSSSGDDIVRSVADEIKDKFE